MMDLPQLGVVTAYAAALLALAAWRLRGILSALRGVSWTAQSAAVSVSNLRR